MAAFSFRAKAIQPGRTETRNETWREPKLLKEKTNINLSMSTYAAIMPLGSSTNFFAAPLSKSL
jgi:hypothetical protein